MKKIFSAIFLSITACIYISGQSIDLGNFENDSSLWENWGGTDSIINNPFPEGNNSAKVLHYRPDSVWRGISRWFDNGILQPDHKSISLDVYVDTITVLQLALLTPVVQNEIFFHDTVLPGAWRHVVFDITKAPILSYQHIAIQTSEKVDYYFDNIRINSDSAIHDSLQWTHFDISKKVFGTFTDSSDFKAGIDLRWDTDSLYMILHVTDDSIVINGTNYLVDNVELYLDLDNSKRIHWPRNGGWMQNDTTFDQNDYQLRLIPGKEWNYTTENQKINGVNYKPIIDSTSYSFYLNISWDSLMPGFIASDSSLIGFDVLISDNDATASDAKRNQITFNSPSVFPYNDPSLWATLKLDSAGTFTQITDTTAPSAASNLMATVSGKNVLLSWQPASDNIAVRYYVVKQGNTNLDTISALKSKNQFQIKNLNPGSYTFSVTALDNYNNASTTITSDSVFVIETTLADFDKDAFTIYPNPAKDYIVVKNITQKNTLVTIFNDQGQRILNKKINNNEALNIQEFKQGIYLIRVSDESNTSIFRFIKK